MKKGDDLRSITVKKGREKSLKGGDHCSALLKKEGDVKGCDLSTELLKKGRGSLKGCILITVSPC